METIKGKIALVTGASAGIGEACARALAANGAALLICGRRIEKLEELAGELRLRHQADVHAFALDVRNAAEVQRILSTLPERWKAVDVLVNNAGLAAGKDPLQTGRIEDWEQMIDTNLKGLLYVTRQLLPAMVARGSGHIVNIGSIAGREAYQGGNVYCATKHGVHALSQALRMDLLGTNVRVSLVAPGMVNTDFSLVRFAGDRARADEVYRNTRPLAATDVADAVIYCVTRPAHVNVSEVLIMPTDQAAVTQVYRRN